MNLRNAITKMAGMAVLGAGLASVPACAQTSDPIPELSPGYQAESSKVSWDAPTALSFTAYGNRDTWHVVLLVSVIVLAVGLIQDDSTLTILGAAGTVVSLIESNGMAFHYDPLRYGQGLVKSGPLFFGINPYGQSYRMPGDDKFRPSAYVGASFKF